MCSSWNVFFSVLLVLVGGGDGAPVVREVQKSYEIRGRTAEELRGAMNRTGPADKSGRRFDGYTAWYVEWKYRYERFDACRLTTLDVSCDVTTTLPRWANEGQATRELRDRWARYVAALTRHEAGHKDIGVRAAASVQEAVGRLPAERTCEALERAVDAKANAILERARAEEAEYDRTTAHGLTQGARFP